MKIIFLHYHTKKGGVTTVLGQQIDALRDDHECILIKGEAGGVDFGIPTQIIPGLAYDRNLPKESSIEQTVAELKKRTGHNTDVLHIHNPLLKKNSRMISIIRRLSEEGLPLLLQIHDFAEDGRPSAYFKKDLYPDGVHYAVINQRDFKLLQDAGLKNDGLHYLPNMVTPLPYGDCDADQDLILYPVRGIRRKNIGEILLLSIFLPENLKMGITLPPNSASDEAVFGHWQNIVRKLNLPVLFNLGIEDDFSCVLGRSKFIITTSIKEGFGFSFLEPWTIGKEVRGRYLEAVCPDFEKNGIVFRNLYRQIWVPQDFMDAQSFEKRWIEGLKAWAGLYDTSIDDNDLQNGLNMLFTTHGIDFGRLDEKAQTEVLHKISEDQTLKNILLNSNPWLKSFFLQEISVDSEMEAKKNRQIILECYGPQHYRRNLLKVYKRVKKHVPHGMEKRKVLEAFLQTDKYLPLAGQ